MTNHKLVPLRIGGIIYKVGCVLNGIYFWPFKKGDYVNSEIMNRSGVSITYPDGVKRTIFNSRYDGQEEIFEFGTREEKVKSPGRPTRANKRRLR